MTGKSKKVNSLKMGFSLPTTWLRQLLLRLNEKQYYFLQIVGKMNDLVSKNDIVSFVKISCIKNQ